MDHTTTVMGLQCTSPDPKGKEKKNDKMNLRIIFNKSQAIKELLPDYTFDVKIQESGKRQTVNKDTARPGGGNVQQKMILQRLP